MVEECGVVTRQAVEAFARNIAGNALIYGKRIRRRSLNLVGKAEQESAQHASLFAT